MSSMGRKVCIHETAQWAMDTSICLPRPVFSRSQSASITWAKASSPAL